MEDPASTLELVLNTTSEVSVASLLVVSFTSEVRVAIEELDDSDVCMAEVGALLDSSVVEEEDSTVELVSADCVCEDWVIGSRTIVGSAVDVWVIDKVDSVSLPALGTSTELVVVTAATSICAVVDSGVGVVLVESRVAVVSTVVVEMIEADMTPV